MPHQHQENILYYGVKISRHRHKGSETEKEEGRIREVEKEERGDDGAKKKTSFSSEGKIQTL